jgi:hypothetical protein
MKGLEYRRTRLGLETDDTRGRAIPLLPFFLETLAIEMPALTRNWRIFLAETFREVTLGFCIFRRGARGLLFFRALGRSFFFLVTFFGFGLDLDLDLDRFLAFFFLATLEAASGSPAGFHLSPPAECLRSDDAVRS